MNRRWRRHVALVAHLVYIALLDHVDSKLTSTPRNLPCTYLSDKNPTWKNLMDTLNQSDFAYLCPFNITGSACPSSTDDLSRIFTVETGVQRSLICDVTSTLNTGCVIDCPLVRFVVRGTFSVESMTFRNYLDRVIVVEGSNSSFTSKASKFEGGASGAISGGIGSSMSIIQGTNISGHQLNITMVNGAALATEGRLEIDGSTFSNNRNSGPGGGAVYVGPQSNVIITGSTFRDNVAPVGPTVVSDAKNRTQVEFSNNRACNNVATLSPNATCQGIYFRSTLQCIPFGKGCLGVIETNCTFIECILKTVVNLIFETIAGLFGGIRGVVN